MNNSDVIKGLTELNRIYKEYDELSYRFARYSGLSESAFWIMYAVCESDKPYIQKDLYNMWSCSKQTINSAVKALLKKNLIELRTADGNRKNKIVCLTDEGRELSERSVMKLIEAERRGFGRFSEEERETLIRLMRKHIGFIKEEACKISDFKNRGQL